MRTDPRIRQSLNQISSNFENATENARAGCFAFTSYLEPFFASLSESCVSCTLFCMPGDRHGRRPRNRDRAEFPFDFYNDDFYEDENSNFLGWGNDELDRLLAGSGSAARGYTRQPVMSYGIGGHSGGNLNARGPGGRRKSAVVPHDGGPDPTIIPNTSYFGFLGRVPFMRSTLRYKPSAADLQDHPGTGRDRPALFRRQRSGTTSSRETENSMRSRADLFPSEDEDDAQPLDDEFDVALRSGSSDTSLNAYRKKRRPKRPSSLGSSSLSMDDGGTSVEQTPVEERAQAPHRLMIPDIDYSSDISHNSPRTRKRLSRDSSYPASLSDISISENTNLLSDPTAASQSHRLASQASGDDAEVLDPTRISTILEQSDDTLEIHAGSRPNPPHRGLTRSPEELPEPEFEAPDETRLEDFLDSASASGAKDKELPPPPPPAMEPSDPPPSYDGEIKLLPPAPPASVSLPPKQV